MKFVAIFFAFQRTKECGKQKSEKIIFYNFFSYLKKIKEWKEKN